MDLQFFNGVLFPPFNMFSLFQYVDGVINMDHCFLFSHLDLSSAPLHLSFAFALHCAHHSRFCCDRVYCT